MPIGFFSQRAAQQALSVNSYEKMVGAVNAGLDKNSATALTIWESIADWFCRGTKKEALKNLYDLVVAHALYEQSRDQGVKVYATQKAMNAFFTLARLASADYQQNFTFVLEPAGQKLNQNLFHLSIDNIEGKELQTNKVNFTFKKDLGLKKRQVRQMAAERSDGSTHFFVNFEGHIQQDRASFAIYDTSGNKFTGLQPEEISIDNSRNSKKCTEAFDRFVTCSGGKLTVKKIDGRFAEVDPDMTQLMRKLATEKRTKLDTFSASAYTQLLKEFRPKRVYQNKAVSVPKPQNGVS